MKATGLKTVRQSIRMPLSVATQVRTMAKAKNLSATRLLVELVEQGIEAERRKQQAFFDLAERFRSEADPEAAKRLGDELGRMRDREIGIADMHPLRLWVDTDREVPEVDWYKDFGSAKLCGRGSLAKTFLLRGQVGKGVKLA